MRLRDAAAGVDQIKRAVDDQQVGRLRPVRRRQRPARGAERDQRRLRGRRRLRRGGCHGCERNKASEQQVLLLFIASSLSFPLPACGERAVARWRGAAIRTRRQRKLRSTLTSTALRPSHASLGVYSGAVAGGRMPPSAIAGQDDYPKFSSLKKSLPLSSTTMKAGKSTTSMRQIASMPSSGYSTVSTFLMQCSARFAAAPPIEAR